MAVDDDKPKKARPAPKAPASSGTPPDNFQSIATAASANPEVAPDPEAKHEQQSAFSGEPDLISRWHRYSRAIAFVAYGTTCLIFLCALLNVLKGMFSLEIPLLYLFAKQGVDWHAWLLVGVGLVIFAAVPLSLSMALMKMIAEKNDDKKEYGMTTPHIEALKIVADIVKNAKP